MLKFIKLLFGVKEKSKPIVFDYEKCTEVHGWYVVDEDYNAYLYFNKPNRSYNGWVYDTRIMVNTVVQMDIFPKRTWQDEPMEVRLSFCRL